MIVAACGGRPQSPTLPVRTPAVAPAHDLAQGKPDKPVEHAEQKDPRVVDLDIIRISAKETAPGQVEMEHVATADLFKQANEAAKSGQTQLATSIYRRIVSEFPESQFAPVSLFNIAAILDGQGDLPGTISTLRDEYGVDWLVVDRRYQADLPGIRRELGQPRFKRGLYSVFDLR